MSWDILHCFADEGIESEALAAYGSITRVGLDPKDNPYTDEVIACDARELALQDSVTFDLGLFHPPCQRWTPGAQMQGTDKDHENLIPVAREIARKHCDKWIIENVPQAPLHQPVNLNGGMFGLPLHYERAFETSYHVDQPRNQTRLSDGHDGFEQHHAKGHWTGSKQLWKSAKGYTGEYNSRSLKREAIPRAYINYLIRQLL
jgi:hypothetical protein